ncbi:MAG: PIN domain-containing protein [Bariatricus sp.]
MKKLIDANVILRYLLGDHSLMSEEAKRIIEEGAFTLPEVLAEVVYVLKGVYHVERKEIAETLIDFLDEISIDNQEIMCEALELFAETSLDFVDCILIARHRILGNEVMSFDKKLNKMLSSS